MPNEQKGITLIALIITVIILLILAGTAISIAINGGDLFSKASTARAEWNLAVDDERTTVIDLINMVNEYDKLEPGLYYIDTGELAMSWEDLMDSSNNMLTESNGNLSRTAFDVNTKFGADKYFKLVINLGYTSINLGGLTKIKEIISPTDLTGTIFLGGCSDLESVNIPSGIIASGAFYNDLNIKNMILGNGVTEIQSGAFGEKSGTMGGYVENLEISDNISSSSVAVVLDYISYNKYHLKKLKLGNAITEIPDSLLSSAIELEKIELGNNVTSIGASVFNYCIKLSEINLPPTLTKIDTAAFMDCISLPENITLPGSITTFGQQVFKRCTSLKTVTIENGITVIPSYSFYGCSSLETVYIPASVTTIEINAFYNCTNITDVYYSGTLEQWNNIEIEYPNDRSL